MKKNIFITIFLCQIAAKSFAQYDFNAFVSKFPLLSPPIESNRLYSYKVGNPLDIKTANYFVFLNHKTGQYGEYPKIKRNDILDEQLDFGTLIDKFYPVGKINLHSNYFTLIAKTYSGGYGVFGLYNFSTNGECISAFAISKYDTGDSRNDSVDFIYQLVVNIYNKNNIELYDDDGDMTIYQTLRLRDDGYFEVIKEYYRLRYNLLEICDKTSSNYDANSCAQTVCDQAHPNYNANNCAIKQCDPASPNYDADICALSRCNPTSPNYNATICSQVCKLNTVNYNCEVCQHQMITPGTPQYSAFLKTFSSYLAQGQPLQAANYFFNNYGFYQLFGITYTLTYNASFTGTVRVIGNYGSSMQFEIGTGFNASVYLTSLCSELQLNITKAVNLFSGTYNISQNYGDFQVYSNVILQCASLHEPSPYLINLYYGKMMGAYYSLSAADQAKLKGKADGVISYYNYNKLNIISPTTKCK